MYWKKPTYSSKYCPKELKDCRDYSVLDWRDMTSLYKIGADLSPTNVWAEFGVGSGISTCRLKRLLGKNGLFYLFDSWEGLPEDWVLSPSMTDPIGRYKFDKLKIKDSRVHFVDGWFKETLPFDFPDQLGLINIDCDLYSSTKTVLTGITKWVGSGTVIIFDEILGYKNYAKHEYRALMEWLDKTERTIDWIGKEKFAAVGVVS